MKAIVVYESHWGNTASIAEAIAAGLGDDARALNTDEATPDVVAGIDLLVVGAPVMGFRLPTDEMRNQIAGDPGKGPTPPDVSHPSMRDWLEAMPDGHACAAVFETRIWWSPGGATGAIGKGLLHHGYYQVADPERFVVKGTYGPLRDGEVERATKWARSWSGPSRHATLPLRERPHADSELRQRLAGSVNASRLLSTAMESTPSEMVGEKGTTLMPKLL